MSTERARDVEVVTEIRSVSAQKKEGTATRNSEVVFSFSVNMEEAERKSDSISLNFQMAMDTDPSIAKFNIEGSTKLTGELSEIDKMLSPDAQTNVPHIFTRIYQQVYSVLFLLASTIDIPTPSPALLKRADVVPQMPK